MRTGKLPLGGPLFLFLALFCTHRLAGQDDPLELTRLRTATQASASARVLPKMDSGWYAGMEYSYLYRRALGTPFFYDQSDLEGTVEFQGERHENRRFLFDLVRDQVVLHAQVRGITESIVLSRSGIGEVELLGNGIRHRFITEGHPSLEGLDLEPGFYEELFPGETLTLLVRHRKHLEFHADQADPYEYVYSRKLWLIYRGQAAEVTRERMLLGLFPEEKRSIRAFRRKELGVRYEQASREQLISLAEFCDRLSEAREREGEK